MYPRFGINKFVTNLSLQRKARLVQIRYYIITLWSGAVIVATIKKLLSQLSCNSWFSYHFWPRVL